MSKAYNETLQQIEQNLAFSVEDVESLVRANENWERKLRQSSDKTSELIKTGAVLIEREEKRKSNEFPAKETPRLSELIANLKNKSMEAKQAHQRRVKQLESLLEFTKLRRDIYEFELWIDEKIRYSKSFNHKSTNPKQSVKMFQRQKELGVEIQTNSGRYSDLESRCHYQMSRNSTVSIYVARELLDEMMTKWILLQKEFNEKAKEFEEAKDILEFNDQLEQMEEWLTEKELMINRSH